MKGTFLKYLFSLSILMLGCFAQINANLSSGTNEYSLLQDNHNQSGFQNSSYNSFKEHLTLNSSLLANKNKLFAEVIDVENEEENNDDYNHKLIPNVYSANCLHIQLLGYLSFELQKTIHRFKSYFFIEPLRLHVRFQVFRI